jgi:hypothetical protein
MNQFLKTIFSLVAITTVSNNAIKAETLSLVMEVLKLKQTT